MQQTSPFRANFSPVKLEPAGRRGVVSPERTSPRLGAGGSWVSAKDNFLVSVLTSTHTQEGTKVAPRGLRDGVRALREAGAAAAAAGGRGRGGPRALTSSAIFQTFDPFRKARCSPAAAARPRWPGRQRARGRVPGRRTTCGAPGSCSRRRRRRRRGGRPGLCPPLRPGEGAVVVAVGSRVVGRDAGEFRGVGEDRAGRCL